ncbi:MAG: MBL fold metallo-hydrolase [Proteobacteria bacterium]|nr:MBL fold metallo-hydrolase [Pseudomonadota bacterium]
MHITFFGGVREVTGSMHLLSNGSDRILLDCGMFQGRRKEADAKNRVLPFDPRILTNIVLSHAHIDHSGRIPLVTKNHFGGRVICTRATAAACEYLLLDSAHIQESDARYLNYKALRSLLSEMKTSPRTKKLSAAAQKNIRRMLKKDRNDLNVEVINSLMDRYHMDRIKPLYSIEDAREALTFFDGYPYRHPVSIGKNTVCTFYDAGHILGSAITMIEVKDDNRTVRICFSGDLGRFGKPIIQDPTLKFEPERLDVDLLITESTYGDRTHEPVKDTKAKLKKILTETVQRGGTLIIPAFAYGRTQHLIYQLHEIFDEGEAPRVPVYVDSPLATKMTGVYGEHPEVYDPETHDTFLEKGKNPFHFRGLHFTSSVEESMALMRDENPHVVISASGMCEAGRILHHLRYKIHNPKHTVLIVGFMAEHTLGRRILELGTGFQASGNAGEPPIVRILGKEYPLRARVEQIGGFSAHADQSELLRFLKESNLNIKKVAAVHGEEDQTLAFVDLLKKDGFDVFAPRAGETVHIG